MGQASRYQRVRRASDADLPALTILRARQFLADYPAHGPAWYTLGIALTELARYDEAESALSKAIEHCPKAKLWIPYSGMGHLYNAIRDYPSACIWFRKAIDAAPDEASGYIFLGSVLAKQGRLTEAEAIHRAGTECIEGCVDEAYLNLGLVLRAQERFEEAEACFREALYQDPQYRAAKAALRDVIGCIAERNRLG